MEGIQEGIIRVLKMFFFTFVLKQALNFHYIIPISFFCIISKSSLLSFHLDQLPHNCHLQAIKGPCGSRGRKTERSTAHVTVTTNARRLRRGNARQSNPTGHSTTLIPLRTPTGRCTYHPPASMARTQSTNCTLGP